MRNLSICSGAGGNPSRSKLSRRTSAPSASPDGDSPFSRAVHRRHDAIPDAPTWPARTDRWDCEFEARPGNLGWLRPFQGAERPPHAVGAHIGPDAAQQHKKHHGCMDARHGGSRREDSLSRREPMRRRMTIRFWFCDVIPGLPVQTPRAKRPGFFLFSSARRPAVALTSSQRPNRG